jgi:hypothetical protein
MIPFLKTLTGERRRDYFREVIKPSYTQFEIVHNFYNDLFLETASEMKKLNDKSLSETSYVLGNVESFRKVMDDYFLKRVKDEHVRAALRQNVKIAHDSIKWSEEKLFYISLLNYFNNDDQQNHLQPTRQIVQFSGEEGKSPSREIYDHLTELSMYTPGYCEKVLYKLESARKNQNIRYLDVSKHYNNIVNIIIQKT